MDLANLYFLAFSAIGIACALCVLFCRHPITGAVSLVGVMLSLAGLYSVLAGPFLGVVQILVYAGAIMMLVVFVIMVLNSARDDSTPKTDPLGLAMLAIPALLVVIVLVATAGVELTENDAPRGTIDDLGARMFDFSDSSGAVYVLFEVIGVALLVALTGAVLLSKRKLVSDDLKDGDANNARVVNDEEGHA